MYRSRENNIDPVLKQRKGDSNIESVTTTKRDSDQNTTKLWQRLQQMLQHKYVPYRPFFGCGYMARRRVPQVEDR